MTEGEVLLKIISISNDNLAGYVSPELALSHIREVASWGIDSWMCRFCKGIFSNKIAKESGYFGDSCLPCSARAELASSPR